MVDGYGIPLGRVRAGANRHDSPLLAPTIHRLDDLVPLPETISVHLDAGYDSAAHPHAASRTWPDRRDRPQGRQCTHPSQPTMAHRTNQSLAQLFNRLHRCYATLYAEGPDRRSPPASGSAG